uniref:Uncharacterized protein n=1 Tax=Sphaerodactylus townsendi TaxID=933632 RepID=A0ACB8EZ83_9SAUR
MGLGWGALWAGAAAVALLLLLLLLPGASWGLPLVALLSALGAAAWLAGRPLRIWRSPEAVGYLGQAGWSRAQVARRVRKSRRTGHLPPVYPNGWFCLLESSRVAHGEVRNVAALGRYAIPDRTGSLLPAHHSSLFGCSVEF